jgi:hypothetical protein
MQQQQISGTRRTKLLENNFVLIVGFIYIVLLYTACVTLDSLINDSLFLKK